MMLKARQKHGYGYDPVRKMNVALWRTVWIVSVQGEQAVIAYDDGDLLNKWNDDPKQGLAIARCPLHELRIPRTRIGLLDDLKPDVKSALPDAAKALSVAVALPPR